MIKIVIYTPGCQEFSFGLLRLSQGEKSGDRVFADAKSKSLELSYE